MSIEQDLRNEQENELAGLKHQLESGEANAAIVEAIARLRKNRDFKLVFEQEYFKEEALRMLSLSADPNLDKDQRADALAMAQSAGHVKRWFHAREKMNDQFQKQDKAEILDTMDVIRAEMSSDHSDVGA